MEEPTKFKTNIFSQLINNISNSLCWVTFSKLMSQIINLFFPTFCWERKK